MIDLEDYKPRAVDEFIGTKQKHWFKLLAKKAQKVRRNGKGKMKVLITGDCGIGKTELAQATAEILVDEDHRAVAYEEVSAANVQIDQVRELRSNLHYYPQGGFRAIIINEADLLPEKCENLMLDVMDELPDCHALLMTSNRAKQFSKRFADRCWRVSIEPPTEDDMKEWLQINMDLPQRQIDQLAKLKGVRSMFNQAETCLMAQQIR